LIEINCLRPADIGIEERFQTMPTQLAVVHSYIRTASPQKPPSEWVVSHALRHGWPQFLAGSPESNTLKKFLASKISLDRCGYAAILGLKKAA
jgi:hypothetical protein